MKRTTIAVIAVLVLAALIWPAVAKLSNKQDKITGNAVAQAGEKLMFYSGASCGCCGVYNNYLQGKSDFTIVNAGDAEAQKDKLAIPANMRSCHTSVIGNYFVEGHVPLEAIDKLLSEKPEIAGIAMPGMPSGAPGMPGSKTGKFVIYAINTDGSFEEYLRM